MELKVSTANVFDDSTARVYTDTVHIKDVQSGAMSINGHNFQTALFGDGLNIKVMGGDTEDPALYINNELALEGCGLLPILESVIEILRLECSTQDEYPTA